MDHRCLYGHRTPSSFGFAIEQGSCPVCGAPMVSVMGYQIARKLAAEVPMDPVQAFNTVRYLESNYELTPKAEDEAEVSVAEIEIDESEAEVTQTGADQSEAEVVEVVEAKPPIVEAPPMATELPSETDAPAPVQVDAAVEDSLSDVERDFFN